MPLWLVRHSRPTIVATTSRFLQLVSACALSVSHGMNDAQKVMGVITMALIAFMASHHVKPLVTTGADATQVAAHSQEIPASNLPVMFKEHHQHLLPTEHLNAKGKPVTEVPLWVVLSCAIAMCLGTMAGGKRIIKTSPLQGFAAQTSGTTTIIAASVAGASPCRPPIASLPA